MSAVSNKENSKYDGVKQWGKAAIAKSGPLIALVALVIASSFLSDRFLTSRNLMNVLRQAAIIGILGLGQTFVILTGGIDLSVGSTLAFSVVLLAGFIETGGVFLGLVMAMLGAASVGLVNGLGVSYGRLPPFIMTLGTVTFARGLAFVYTSGMPIPILDMRLYELGNGYLGGIPIPAIIFVIMLLISLFVLNKTPFGRYVYAIGSNQEAALLAGVPVKRYKVLVYVIAALFAGVSGILFGSQMGVGSPIAGEGYELDAIAAVVVGGASTTGGVGTVGGTFIGTLIIGALANILNLTGVNPFVQRLFKGALIIVAVLIVNNSSRRNKS